MLHTIDLLKQHRVQNDLLLMHPGISFILLLLSCMLCDEVVNFLFVIFPLWTAVLLCLFGEGKLCFCFLIANVVVDGVRRALNYFLIFLVSCEVCFCFG